MFDPVPSETHSGHFKTFLEMASKEGMKYVVESSPEIGRCSLCLNWYFTSVTELHCHRRLLHPKKKLHDILEKSEIEDQGSDLFRCRHKINGKECSLSFQTYHQLNKHKNKSGHKRKREVESKKAADAKKTKHNIINKEKATIKNFFAKKAASSKTAVNKDDEIDMNVQDVSSSDEDDEPCASSNCSIDQMMRSKKTLVWVPCDVCDDWWHSYCVDGTNSQMDNFTCDSCL